MPPKPSCVCGKCPTCYFRTKQRESRLKRKTELKRTPIKRSSKLIARNVPVKKKRSKPRRGPMRDKGYREWLRERNCIACLTLPLRERSMVNEAWSGCEAAHTKNNGRSSKGPDSSCVPLCKKHHDEMDGRLSTAITTKEAFEAKYRINLEHEAAAHYRTYEIWKESGL